MIWQDEPGERGGQGEQGERVGEFRLFAWFVPFVRFASIALLGLSARFEPLGAQAPDSALVLTREDLRAAGRTVLAEALQVLLPELNLTRPSGAEGTDHLPPLTRRGMGADQLLILVDGRPRLPSALVHVNATVGQGQAGIDLHAIPLAAVERVEVLRGTPSARWGPGSQAGVINIVLATDRPAELTGGFGLATAGDGAAAQLAGTHRVRLGGGGFLQLTGEYRGRGATNRAEPDRREQFFPADPRNQDPRYANRVNHRLGDPETHDLTAVARAGGPLTRNLEWTAALAAHQRRGRSAALWRRPSEDATVRSLYPTGFLPRIVATIRDYAADLGARGDLAGGRWRWELAAGYGSNTLRFDVHNTANASLGPLSPTRLDAGTLGATRLTAELALRGRLGRMDVTAGIAGGSEGYRIEPGERDSYRFGAVPIQDGPDAGGFAPLGAQGFPGFMPDDSGHFRRGNVAGYAEVRMEPAPRLVLGGAARLEQFFPDEGAPLAGLTGSVEVRPVGGLLLRGSGGTGYRLPSLPQRWYSRTLVPVTDNVGFFDLVRPTADSVAIELGGPALRAERSWAWAAGLGMRALGGRLRLDADYYRIEVQRRITLTGKFEGPVVRSRLEVAGLIGIDAVRLFVNAADTRTAGFEARAGYDFQAAGLGVRLEAAWDHHRVRVVRVDSVSGFLSQFRSAFFPADERVRIESGQPGDHALLAARVTGGPGFLILRVRYHGAVRDFGPAPDGTLAQTYGGRWLADLEVAWARTGRLTVAAGVRNLLDTYPDRNRFGDPAVEGNSYFGIFPYANVSPFGFTGRAVYGRMEWRY
ncbi:MAG: TonB-dependent receptor plug domain-containing protein [Gemmatimonadales bacterium]